MIDNSTRPPAERDDDCDETLRSAYFDPAEDEESTRRHKKPMSAKDKEALHHRGCATG